ncbi:DNA mismatch repair protein MutS [Mangrovibacillus cuniculi]|uniref:DNA mismatch repair protein MutS n=1 Tax=Mangrovibacillus cuniculi TaxID=2593652 RepID=A0A7S8HF10_9BACI|nr:DNA mismatch repair protein MutS [Mangrovibacillus cuniculi]QPC46429.1 DNA mismatch repair protein MutS [Mangrovibacillus cuniculi]
MTQQYTPMIQQYLSIKADYQDAFLFFRLGDFYEMFFQDAIDASQLLEITLTSRDGGGKERIPMCGVPYHSARNYIERLLDKGCKVAICEQVEDPKHTKGVVKREVVQLITPGTIMEGSGLHDKENHFMGAVQKGDGSTFGVAISDLTTGENRLLSLEGTQEVLLQELLLLEIKEVVLSTDLESLAKIIQERTSIIVSFEDDLVESSLVHSTFQVTAKEAAKRLLSYLYRTQKRSLDHLQPFEQVISKQFVKIDYFSKKNLELTETIREKGRKGSLLWLMDETKTAMGGRLLKQWMDRPLLAKDAIEYRLQLVELWKERFFEREDLREQLKEVYDLERLAGRVAFGNVNARDLVQLRKSLQQIPVITSIIHSLNSDVADELVSSIDPCEDLTDLLERAIVEQPPLSIKEGGYIREGFNDELDQYKDASTNGKTWLAELEKTERERTGIKNLKIGYNRIFGYFIEITKANISLLNDDRYERKQTLANAERYITPELKEKESVILSAQEKSIDLEYHLFVEIREQVKEFIPRLQQLAKTVSTLDVLQCFATVAEKYHYVKPTFTSDGSLMIKEGRHPVVEKVMNSQNYVPNDCKLHDGRSMYLITGPNMSGKSTYMRQIALISILAQMGSYVPAQEAQLPIFDQVFTRIGAADDLVSGQSTFMVEMLEARNAIVHATKDSLILFDEIGRGTSTYDGMALAQAMMEHIHEHIGSKTLFSTHYHELTALENELHGLKNVHVRATEHEGKVVFLHSVRDGAADKSYGIHVAELAELPKSLIKRAEEILHSLETGKEHYAQKEIAVTKEEKPSQLSLFIEEESKSLEKKPSSKENAIMKELTALNVMEMTPLDAMNALYALQKKARK